MKHKKKLLDFAEVFDRFRVVPRILVALYAVMLYNTTEWFQGLSDPSNAQSMFISIIWGGAAAIFGLYTNSGNKNTKE